MEPPYSMFEEEQRERPALAEQEQWGDETGLGPLHLKWPDDMSHWRFPEFPL